MTSTMKKVETAVRTEQKHLWKLYETLLSEREDVKKETRSIKKWMGVKIEDDERDSSDEEDDIQGMGEEQEECEKDKAGGK